MNFIRIVVGGKGTLVILDLGIDISVLPMSYREVEFPLERVIALRYIQGGKMTNGGMRQAMVELEDEEGHLVELRENFTLSNVKEPLFALGKLLRRGWKIEKVGQVAKRLLRRWRCNRCRGKNKKEAWKISCITVSILLRT